MPTKTGTVPTKDTVGYTGIYEKVKNFIAKYGDGVRAVTMTVNCREEDLQKRIESDLGFMSGLIGSAVYKIDKNVSDKGYPHGFIVAFCENGALARLSYTCSPLAERTEISAFAPSANVYADSETNKVIVKTGELFDDDREI